MVRDKRGDDRLPGAIDDLRALVFGIRPSVRFSHSEDSSVPNNECCILDGWLPAAVDQRCSGENSGRFGVKQGPGEEECYDAQQISAGGHFHEELRNADAGFISVRAKSSVETSSRFDFCLLRKGECSGLVLRPIVKKAAAVDSQAKPS